MSKFVRSALIVAACMGVFTSSAHAFDPVAFGEMIKADNPATTYSPAKSPC